MNKNIIEHKFNSGRVDKEKMMSQKAITFWFMGLSGSGKSTIANEVEQLFSKNNFVSTILDGDSLRNHLCADLGFSQDDRKENLRRAASVSKIFNDSGIITLCSFITPLSSHRDMIKEIIGNNFKLIYIHAPLDICEKRDPKGLYNKARAGKIKDFTGIDSLFEEPVDFDLKIDSTKKNPIDCAKEIYNYFINDIKVSNPG